MKQFLKDVLGVVIELVQIPLGLGMWIGGIGLMVFITKELGIKEEYAVPFMVVQGIFIVITLNHFFGKQEKQNATK